MTDPRMTPTNDAPVTVEREYRKTATIRAVQWWKMGDHPAVRMYDDITADGKDTPWIDTLEGGHIVTPGDWIATGVKGEHWAIKPDVFAATYSPVEPVMDFGEAIDPNASHNRRHRLAALASAPACAASPDHADIMETITNAADDWQKQGYPTALAEVRDMANVGRSLLERIADHSSEGPLKGWHPADCPTEVVCDLLNMLADASAPAGDAFADAGKPIAADGDGVEAPIRNLAFEIAREALARPRAAVGEQSREAIARALAQRWIDRGNARVTGATYSCWEEMPGSYTRDFYDDADAALAALAPTPADDEATYTRWLAGDETLPPLPREQYLRFQARSDRVIEDRRHLPSSAGGGVEEVRRNPEDPEWSYCPACKTGFLDTGYECNSCGFDAQPLVHLQSACEERGERMHPSGLYESEIANPVRLALQSPPAKVEG